MTLNAVSLLFLLGLICFVVGAFYSPPRGSLVAAGLACLAAGFLFGG